MTDIYDGDVFITLDGDGADMIFNSGQPVMDAGMVNHVNLTLLTDPNWWGNDIEPVAERRYTSDFLEKSRQPITRQSLIDTQKEGIAALSGDEFSWVDIVLRNPQAQNLNVDVTLYPPSNDEQTLQLTRVGANWINQKNDPAGGKETT